MADTGTSRRKRGPYAPTLVRRRQIATAVLQLVDEIGPESLTTSEVALRSKTPETTVLYHFPSRDDLLVAALELADEQNAEASHLDDPDLRLDPGELARVYRSGSPADPRSRLGQLARGIAATPGTSGAAYVRRRVNRQVAVFARMFDQRKRDGLAHPDVDSIDLARQTIALWEGLASVFADDPEADAGRLLAEGVRRLSGESWITLQRAIGRVERSF